MIQRGDVLDGKYEILYLKERGGMSKIWRALDTHVNKEWVVKEVDKTSKEYDDSSIRREYEIHRRLDHPAIPRIVDIIEHDDALYIIMDKIDGENLLKILKTRGIPRQETVVSWMLDVCDAISYLHRFDPPILYRDMKPANIMLTEDQRIKVVDFGISKDYDANSEDTQPLGTRGYAAPEQWTRETDPRSDIYSIGRTMFHLLTGKDPTKIPLVKDFPKIREIDPDLSSGLERIIDKATEDDKEKRYQTVTELANALESYKSLEQEHIEELEEKEKSLRRGVTAGGVLTALGVFLLVVSLVVTARSYQGLLDTTPGTLQATENYKMAIEMNPSKPDGYIKLLAEYTGDGSFKSDELSEYVTVYEGGKDKLAKNEDSYSDVNYQIGEAILTYYEGESDSSARAKLLHAEPFFSEVTSGESKDLAANYVVMANFYKDYILADSTLVVKGATKDNMTDLLASCNSAIDNLQSEKFSGRTKMKAIVYDFVLTLLSAEASEMHDADIDRRQIDQLIDKIRNDNEITPENAVAAKDAADSVTRGYAEKNAKEVTYSDGN